MATPSTCPATSTDPETAAAIKALRTASAHVEWTLARALEAHGLTTAQFAALQVLHEAEPDALASSEVGHRLAGPAPDVTRLLDRLETAGLVSRERDQTDRRLVFARITDAGRTLLGKALPAVQEAEEKALTGLEADDRARLSVLLAGIRRNCPGN